jgi:hypothetical protein
MLARREFAKFDTMRIDLRGKDEVASVEITFPAQEDFILWCKMHGFQFELRLVDSGNTFSGGFGSNVQKRFLRSESECFASVRSFSAHEIELRSAGCLDSI